MNNLIMTRQQTTQNNTTQQNQEKQKPFKYNEDAILAIRNVENRKDTKKMETALEGFKQEGCEKTDWFNPEKTQKVAIDTKKLGELHELAKGSKAETLDLVVETDKPVKAQLLTEEKEEVGEILLAPKILEENNQIRQQETEKTTQKQAEDLIKKGLKKLEETDLTDEEKQNLIENLKQMAENGGEK